MGEVIIDLHTCDVGVEVASPEEFTDLIIGMTLKSWDEGADIVVFPEYTWLVLERFAKGESKIRWIAEHFWNELLPTFLPMLTREGKACVLGTVPFIHESGLLRNRAFMVVNGKPAYQDKINLTPWEKDFSGGDALHLFDLNGCRFAVIICLDIEVPELSVALRGSNVDVVLVPSATETILGVERVGRCASARAVELGAHVAVSHLVGKTTESDLVDENVGRLAFFSPSQSHFKNSVREDAGEAFDGGFYSKRCIVDVSRLARLRKRWAETNPALLTPQPICVKTESEQPS